MVAAVNRIGPDIPSTQAVEDPAARAAIEALRLRAEMMTRRHPGTVPLEELPASATLAQVIAAINAFMRSQQI